MPQIIEMELPSGRVVQVEVEGAPSASRTQGTFGPMSTGAGQGGVVRRKLQDLADELKEVLSSLADSLDKVSPRAPDKTTLELSAGLGAGGLLSFLGKAEAGIKITMTWENKGDSGSN